MERRSKKEGICAYTLLIHFAVQSKLTQQCKRSILKLKNKIKIKKKKERRRRRKARRKSRGPGREVPEEGDLCILMADSSCCMSETNTML